MGNKMASNLFRSTAHTYGVLLSNGVGLNIWGVQNWDIGYLLLLFTDSFLSCENSKPVLMI